MSTYLRYISDVFEGLAEIEIDMVREAFGYGTATVASDENASSNSFVNC